MFIWRGGVVYNRALTLKNCCWLKWHHRSTRSSTRDAVLGTSRSNKQETKRRTSLDRSVSSAMASNSRVDSDELFVASGRQPIQRRRLGLTLFSHTQSGERANAVRTECLAEPGQQLVRQGFGALIGLAWILGGWCAGPRRNVDKFEMTPGCAEMRVVHARSGIRGVQAEENAHGCRM